MEETSKPGEDRIASAARSLSSSTNVWRPVPVVETMLPEQPLLPQDERTVSMNPSPDAVVPPPSLELTGQHQSSYTGGTQATTLPQDQTYYYGGYENNTGWDQYSYVNANGLQIVPPPIYNDNSSVLFHSGYGVDTPVAYGQFSPLASPMSPIMFDSQIFSPHQIPASHPYYPPSVSPGVSHVNSSFPAPQTEMMTAGNNFQEAVPENFIWGQGPGYFIQYGHPSGGGMFGEQQSNSLNSIDKPNYMTPLTSPAGAYSQPFGILGPYEHNVGQEQRPYHGYGWLGNSSVRPYPQGNSYQSSNYGTAMSNWSANKHVRQIPHTGGVQPKQTIFSSHGVENFPNDHNRGPRASKLKGKGTIETISSLSAGLGKSGPSTSGLYPGIYNLPDFVTEYDNAKFFIIKSFSEDNVHKSVKYSIWSSTALGNRKLDAAYREAKEMKDDCPVFLLFSVNASGQFCGVAEMIGTVDFENDADYWQQDRWSGQFHVKWHMIKDVPNTQFRHILIENNENKPVTHSRDSQEVKLAQGIEMLKIFKSYEAETSLLDDFSYYDEREKNSQERKAKMKVNITETATGTTTILGDESIAQLSEKFAGVVELRGEGDDVVKKSE
ncbi:YTH domain-containing protein ECT1-like [Impatiens glandulifera]|uniref:YTH domain-containing protein ECT1-like n=1 Tax=Impatiens glandulifera TaxID=253017 RepID=UPI001FB09B13|nr:YTH domain-containing protein ECT1-like [Impatiens glandulifera]